MSSPGAPLSNGDDCVPDPWYITLFLLVTHIILVATMLLAWKSKRKITHSGIIFIFSGFIIVASVTYHTCASACYCLQGKPVYIFQIFDNTLAMSAFLILFIIISSVASLYESSRQGSIFWSQVTYFVLFGVILFIVLTSITGPDQGVPPERSLLIVLVLVVLLFLKFLYIDHGRVMVVEKFTDSSVYIGLLLCLIGVVFFLIEIEGYTWLFHGLWHYFAFTGVTLTMYGTTAYLPKLPHNYLAKSQRRDLKKAGRYTYRAAEMEGLSTSYGQAYLRKMIARRGSTKYIYNKTNGSSFYMHLV